MPHPSHPVDDTSVRSYNREHGRLVAVSRTFGSCLLLPFGVDRSANQRAGRMSDG
ncbi:hypothetical protein BV20DRAFT_970253, partial [Pilatotrama ljubarskyi]